MDFNRDWTQFALEAEEEDFGMARIAKAHNALRAQLAEKDARIARLTEAAIAVRQLVMDAQDILATYILPDSNIDDYDCCNRLLELTDGPRQRAVFEQLRAALAEPPK